MKRQPSEHHSGELRRETCGLSLPGAAYHVMSLGSGRQDIDDVSRQGCGKTQGTMHELSR